MLKSKISGSVQEVILPDFPDDDNTVTATVTKSRRVSFGTNFVKEFIVGSAVSQCIGEYEQAFPSSDSSNADSSHSAAESEISDQSEFLPESHKSHKSTVPTVGQIAEPDLMDNRPKPPKFSSTICFSADSPTADMEFTEGCITLAKSILDKKNKEMTVIIQAKPKETKDEEKPKEDDSKYFEGSQFEMSLTRCLKSKENKRFEGEKTKIFSKFEDEMSITKCNKVFIDDESDNSWEDCKENRMPLDMIMRHLDKDNSDLENDLFNPEKSFSNLFNLNQFDLSNESEKLNMNESMDISTDFPANVFKNLQEAPVDEEPVESKTSEVNCSERLISNESMEISGEIQNGVFSSLSNTTNGDEFGKVCPNLEPVQFNQVEPEYDKLESVPMEVMHFDLAKDIETPSESESKIIDGNIIAASEVLKETEELDAKTEDDKIIGEVETEDDRVIDKVETEDDRVIDKVETEDDRIIDKVETEDNGIIAKMDIEDDKIINEKLEDINTSEKLTPNEFQQSENFHPNNIDNSVEKSRLLEDENIPEPPLPAEKIDSQTIESETVNKNESKMPESPSREEIINEKPADLPGNENPTELTELGPDNTIEFSQEFQSQPDNECQNLNMDEPMEICTEEVKPIEETNMDDVIINNDDGSKQNLIKDMEISLGIEQNVSEPPETPKVESDKLNMNESMDITVDVRPKSPQTETNVSEESYEIREPSLVDIKVIENLKEQSKEPGCVWSLKDFRNPQAKTPGLLLFDCRLLQSTTTVQFNLKMSTENNLNSCSIVTNSEIILNEEKQWKLAEYELVIGFGFRELKKTFDHRRQKVENIRHISYFLDEINLFMFKMNSYLQQIHSILTLYPGSRLKESVLSFRLYSFPIFFSCVVSIDLKNLFRISESCLSLKKDFGSFDEKKIRNIFQNCLKHENSLCEFVIQSIKYLIQVEKESGFVSKRNHIRLLPDEMRR